MLQSSPSPNEHPATQNDSSLFIEQNNHEGNYIARPHPDKTVDDNIEHIGTSFFLSYLHECIVRLISH